MALIKTVCTAKTVEWRGEVFDKQPGFGELPGSIPYRGRRAGRTILLFARRADGSLGRPTPVVTDAYRAGLVAHAWTFRAENAFLPADFRSGADPAEHGDLVAEVRAFLRTGLDGVFSDHPDLAVRAVEGSRGRR